MTTFHRAKPDLFAEFLVAKYHDWLKARLVNEAELFMTAFEKEGYKAGAGRWERVESILVELTKIDEVEKWSALIPYVYGSALAIVEEYRDIMAEIDENQKAEDAKP
jgi:hypothetical protein